MRTLSGSTICLITRKICKRIILIAVNYLIHFLYIVGGWDCKWYDRELSHKWDRSDCPQLWLSSLYGLLPAFYHRVDVHPQPQVLGSSVLFCKHYHVCQPGLHILLLSNGKKAFIYTNSHPNALSNIEFRGPELMG